MVDFQLQHSNNAVCGLVDMEGRRILRKKLPCNLAKLVQSIPGIGKILWLTITMETVEMI